MQDHNAWSALRRLNILILCNFISNAFELIFQWININIWLSLNWLILHNWSYINKLKPHTICGSHKKVRDTTNPFMSAVSPKNKAIFKYKLAICILFNCKPFRLCLSLSLSLSSCVFLHSMHAHHFKNWPTAERLNLISCNLKVHQRMDLNATTKFTMLSISKSVQFHTEINGECQEENQDFIQTLHWLIV